MRVRFAPSPTGLLHVGNARTAIFNWLVARGQGGVFIVRIEDTDLERSTRESEQKILDDLRWLGVQWDEGIEVGGDYGPYRQSERLHLYREHAGRLIAENLAYYCFCTAEKLEAERQAQLAAGLPPRYSGTCRALPVAESARRRSAGEPAVIRLRVPQDRAVTFDDLVRGEVSFHTSVIGDPILVRSDGIPAYNFAVVVDDALMAVTHVIRGEDHISNTPRQVLLYEAFGWTPPQFAHLPLVLGPDHAPLSKRHGATSVAEFRARGYLPEALFNYLALVGSKHGGANHEGSKHEGSKHEGSKHEGSKHEGSKHEGSKHEGSKHGGSKHEGSNHGGSNDGGSNDEGSEAGEIMPALEMARRFRLEDVSHSAGVFDEDKLAWVNRHYLKSLPAGRLVAEALPFLRERGQVIGPVDAAGQAWLERVVPPAAGSVDRLAQVPDRLSTIFSFDAAATLADPELAGELAQPAGRAVVNGLADVLQSSPRLTDRESFRAAAARVREATGQKGRALFHPIRVAVTGAAQGPELDIIVPAIEAGADLPASSGIAPITGCRERAAAVRSCLE